ALHRADSKATSAPCCRRAPCQRPVESGCGPCPHIQPALPLDAMIQGDAHARVTAAHAFAQMTDLVCPRRRADQGADDLQRLPRMSIVIGRVKLKPKQAPGASLL